MFGSPVVSVGSQLAVGSFNTVRLATSGVLRVHWPEAILSFVLQLRSHFAWA